MIIYYDDDHDAQVNCQTCLKLAGMYDFFRLVLNGFVLCCLKALLDLYKYYRVC